MRSGIFPRVWRQILSAALLGAGLSLLTASPANAACTGSPAAKELFPAVEAATCKLVNTQTFQNVAIRTYQDEKMPDASANALREAIAGSAIKSLNAFLAVMPGLKFHPVNFIISPMATLGGEEGANAEEGICIITVNGDAVNGKMDGGGKAKDFPALFGESFKFTVAHELVHCIQDWNYRAQVTPNAALWWREGTANYLASTQFSFATPSFSKFLKEFDSMSATKPLTQMSYQSYVFFAWLGQTKGNAAIFKFMAAMPKSDSELSQRKALLGFVTPEQMQEFAEAYLDGTIKGAKMETIGKPDMGTMETIGGSAQKNYTGKPFTIMRAQFSFSGGDYEITTDSSHKIAPKFSRSFGPWKDIEPKIEAACSQPPAFRLGAFVVEDSELKLKMSVKKTKEEIDCKGCQDFGARDKCLVGRWIMDNEALAAFFQLAWDNQTGPIVIGDAILELRDNGKMALSFNKLKITTFYKVSETQIKANGAQTGTWSSKPGYMQMCPVTNTVQLDIMARIFYPADVTTNDSVKGSAQNDTYTFQCSGDEMTMSHPDAKVKGQQVIWHLSREK